ncbi:hypothetical protein HY251_14095 [bacterium]|nr:hypothetical protein [bacterium]
MRKLAGWLAFLLGALALFPLQGAIDRVRTRRASSLLYMPDRRLMKVVSCGYGPVIADLVWVQSINYVIEEFGTGATHINHLYDLFDTLTELDPNFIDAYVTGAMFLSALAQEPERALPLLEKGQGHLLGIEIDGADVREDRARAGRVAPDHPERWRILHETAATHLVTLAGFSPSDKERQEEIRAAGRILVFGAKRYPRSRCPSRPEWYESVGPKLERAPVRLARRGGPGQGSERGSRADWRLAQKLVWGPRRDFSPEGSPMRAVAVKRLAEIDATEKLEDLEGDLERFYAAQPLPATPPSLLAFEGPRSVCLGLDRDMAQLREQLEDPLKVGFFLVQPESVLSRADRARFERELEATVFDFLDATGALPASIEKVEELFLAQGRSIPRLPHGVDAFVSPRTGSVSLVGKVVAPAVDAATFERAIARRVAGFRSRNDRWPTSLEELEADLARQGSAPIVAPRWIRVSYDASSGECRAEGRAPF